MLIKKPDDIPSSDITDENLILNRRNFIRGGVLAVTATSTAYLYRRLATPSREKPQRYCQIERHRRLFHYGGRIRDRIRRHYQL